MERGTRKKIEAMIRQLRRLALEKVRKIQRGHSGEVNEIDREQLSLCLELKGILSREDIRKSMEGEPEFRRSMASVLREYMVIEHHSRRMIADRLQWGRMACDGAFEVELYDRGGARKSAPKATALFCRTA